MYVLHRVQFSNLAIKFTEKSDKNYILIILIKRSVTTYEIGFS